MQRAHLFARSTPGNFKNFLTLSVNPISALLLAVLRRLAVRSRPYANDGGGRGGGASRGPGALRTRVAICYKTRLPRPLDEVYGGAEELRGQPAPPHR